MSTRRSVAGRLLRPLAYSVAIAGVLAASAYAERPRASLLLPENTLGMISVPDTRDLAERFMNTNLGRMTKDPQMQPVVIQLYNSLSDLVATVQDAIGLSLPEMLSIPQGEATFAVVAVKDSLPVIVVLLDAGDQVANARKLVDHIIDLAVKEGSTKSEETVSGTKITYLEAPRGRGVWTLGFLEKDSTIAICSNSDVMKTMLATWNGEKNKTLADNFNFNSIMNRCRGEKDESPQIIWFIDPINIMRSMAEQNAGIRIGVAMLPVLGLDGLAGIGGSMIYDTEQYDAISHMHVLLDNPRSGIIKMIALEPGVSTPEPWVPADVAQYVTAHWKFDTTLKTLGPIYDSLAGTGAFSAMMQQRFSQPLGVDFEKEIIPALEGRITYVTWFEKPTTQVSGITLVGLKLKDIEPVKKAVENIAKRGEQIISKQTCAGKDYYRVNIPVPPAPPPPARGPDTSQLPVPCFGIVDDYLIITNRPGLYEKALQTLAEGSKSLADEMDFKIITGKIQRQSGGAKPVLLGFNRPEEGLRYWYDMLNADRTREALKRQAENNPFFRTIDDSLQKNPLPPFEVIQRYLAPEGTMAVDDDTGFHFMGFTMRRKTD